MRILISIFSLLLFISVTSFGQKKAVKRTNCFDLKVKKFEYTLAKSASRAGSQVGITFKVKNIGNQDFNSSQTVTLELYAITGSKKNMVESWDLSPIDVNNFEEYSWGNWYLPVESLPTQFEVLMNSTTPLFGDCNLSNNSRIQDF